MTQRQCIDRKNIEVEVCVEMSVLASPELKKGKMLSLSVCHAGEDFFLINSTIVSAKKSILLFF